ncbi:ABC transporter substrate-binding protein [Nocardioides sp. InS609-2]|uniref:ABC transporter substrate-binding protein n=1 Tax=Nocardioides sp. InS609-2 TaxID=2760705 RepID=UPI0020BF37C2|nr:ABC transporter substrate-binding protein [Nocardioides sp. InS609-2]
MKKSTQLLALTATATLALSGCSLDGGSSDSPDAGRNRAISAVQISSSGQIERITGPQNPGSQIGMGLCEPLTGIKEDGTIFMRAAESVESTDQRTWTVKIQPDRTFSDGTPITAKTWVDSFNFSALGSNAMAGNYAFIDIEGYDDLNPSDGSKPKGKTLSGLELVDDTMFTLTMNKPYNDVPYLLSTLPYCPMPESGFADPIAYDKLPIGNGPYTLTKLDPQVEAIEELDPNYQGWVPEGAAEKITFKVYRDANTAYQDVVAGNVDILRSLPPGLVAQGKNSLGEEGLTAIASNTLETYISWPTYLDDTFPQEVREAFSMIVDRNAIAEKLFLGSSLGARSLMPDSVAAYREDACETCTYDPEKAKSLIEQAGFTGSIPLTYDAANTTDASTALAISNEARKIGLDVEPRPVAGNALGEQINNYELEGPTIQLWGSSFPSASEWVASILVDANYHLKYANPTATKEVAAAWAAKSPEEATPHWQAAEDAILADQVLQPLYYQVMYIAHKDCVDPASAGGDMQIYRSNVTC